MRIKVLECPRWIKLETRPTKSQLSNHWTQTNPLFHREGTYLINGKVIIEWAGKAYESQSYGEQFQKDLKYSQYRELNLLSQDQTQAIKVLMSAGLASKEQIELYFTHLSRQKARRTRLRFKIIDTEVLKLLALNPKESHAWYQINSISRDTVLEKVKTLMEHGLVKQPKPQIQRFMITDLGLYYLIKQQTTPT